MPPRGYRKRRAAWTREDVIAALTAYRERYGEVPAATDFNPSDCRRSARISAARSLAWLDRARRGDQEMELPYPRTVQTLFGSWAAAVRAAGMDPRARSLDLRVAEARYASPDALQKLMARARTLREPDALRRCYYEIAEAAIGLAEGMGGGGDLR